MGEKERNAAQFAKLWNSRRRVTLKQKTWKMCSVTLKCEEMKPEYGEITQVEGVGAVRKSKCIKNDDRGDEHGNRARRATHGGAAIWVGDGNVTEMGTQAR